MNPTLIENYNPSNFKQKVHQEQGLELILYVEEISTRKTERTELQHALKAAKKGDRFVVYKLNCLARSTKELYPLIDEMGKRGINFVSIHDSSDITTLLVAPCSVYLPSLSSLNAILFNSTPRLVWKRYGNAVSY